MGIVATPTLDYACFGPSYEYRRYHNTTKCIINTKPPTSQLSLRRPKPISTVEILKHPKNPTNTNSSSDSWEKKLSTSSTRTTTTDILRLMDSLCIPISHDIYASLVKECTIAGDSHRARELHDHIKDSHIKPTLPLLNRLLLMHVSCGRIHPARNLFDVMPLKDRNSWAIMIVGYVNIDDYEEAINLFVQMQGERQCSPMLEFPAWIIVLVLKACVLTGNMGLGKQVHGFLLKLGGVNDSSSTASSLINFYGKFRCLDDATFVFDQMLCRDTVIWTARIVNSCREGHFHEVINDFLGMGRQGIKWNSFTFSSVLKACAGINDGGECGRQVHANAIKLGIESDVFVQCGLIDMYRKCVLLIDAKRVFEMISHKRNPACWNAMLMGYLHNGFYVEAIKFLYKMKTAGMEVQESLVNEVRIVCGSKIHENSIECNN